VNSKTNTKAGQKGRFYRSRKLFREIKANEGTFIISACGAKFAIVASKVPGVLVQHSASCTNKVHFR
jgi:hypothetical protein